MRLALLQEQADESELPPARSLQARRASRQVAPQPAQQLAT
ncbi:MAG TPA: hypothetical protein VN792_05980 [Candidatus Acidoferrales bacterium]|nr:hypothetical protein [Candidatus Acidoferrales bacterium]